MLNWFQHPVPSAHSRIQRLNGSETTTSKRERTVMRNALICLALILLAGCAASAVAPTVTSIVARQRTDGSGKVDITYNLSDPDSATVYISVAISTYNGASYLARNYVTGDVGWVRPGSRRMVWDAKTDLGTSAVFPNCKAKITADDSSGGVYPGEMIYIPAGSFLMGNSNGGDDAVYRYSNELPQHSVYLSGYYIGKYEVTRGEYQAFMTATGRAQPYYWDAVQNWGSGSFTQTDSYPVLGVSYYEAEAFCNWAGGHLPTEAQWEKAARWTGSHPNVYPWGDTWDVEKCNNYYDSNPAGGGYAKYQTSPVGSYPSGASPYGCMDMAGNVWQWVQDWYKSYPGSSNPFDYTNSYRVLRGGGWYYDDGSYRCASRNGYYPHYYSGSYGFRLAR